MVWLNVFLAEKMFYCQLVLEMSCTFIVDVSAWVVTIFVGFPVLKMEESAVSFFNV